MENYQCFADVVDRRENLNSHNLPKAPKKILHSKSNHKLNESAMSNKKLKIKRINSAVKIKVEPVHNEMTFFDLSKVSSQTPK